MLAPITHSGRLLGYLPLLGYSFFRWPHRTLKLAASYYYLRWSSVAWRSAVRALLWASASREPRLICAQSMPYDRKRQYLLAAHPHGILNFGWYNLICRHGWRGLVDGLDFVACMAPAVAWYPLYGELFGTRAADPSAATISRVLAEGHHSVAIIPG